ncbi:hypothetical protein BC830DRAFT_1083520 [Chytriomyces sp. MP71]|nr:hypothetical protein BC830DRAFT_1083520 [Chytriomyces sp. MP71]
MHHHHHRVTALQQQQHLLVDKENADTPLRSAKGVATGTEKRGLASRTHQPLPLSALKQAHANGLATAAKKPLRLLDITNATPAKAAFASNSIAGRSAAPATALKPTTAATAEKKLQLQQQCAANPFAPVAPPPSVSKVTPVQSASAAKRRRAAVASKASGPSVHRTGPPLQERVQVEDGLDALPEGLLGMNAGVAAHVTDLATLEEEGDEIPDIEYAPLHDVVPLEFVDDDIDITALITPTWREVYPPRRSVVELDELSDVSDPFDVIPAPEPFDMRLPDDPIASVGAIEPFLF